MNKRMTGLLVILLGAGAALYFFVFRKSGLQQAAIVPNPAVPPSPAGKQPAKKKTVFGQIVAGVTEVARTIPGQTGQTLSQYGDALGNITR